jgi:tRNA modification GTPase
MTSRLDTIAAIATPPGRGGVAIVRISGSRACAILGELFRQRERRVVLAPRRIYVGRLLDRLDGNALDDVLVFTMPAPHSYTGEDVAEIQCHGGTVVSQRVLESVCRAGARVAEPGEFTKRAFLNGKLDLAQAEAVADLIAAGSEAGRRLAWSQLEGTLSSRVSALRETVIAALAYCEATLDFPEDDIAEPTIADLARRLSDVRVSLQLLVDGFERARIRYEGARVALVGRPNVGKSSLLNALAGRDRALVTAVAGTTRDVVEATIAVDGTPVVLMDTAGIRATTDVVEALGIERTAAAVADAAAVVAVFDRATELGEEDRMVADAVRGVPTIGVLTKSDLSSRLTPADVAALLGSVPIVEVSALTGAGLAALTDVLGRTLLAPSAGADEEVVIFRVRHRDAARQAIEDLARAERALLDRAPIDLVADDLAAAGAALGGITGAVSTEDVLDRVFAEFCIGK